MSAMIEPRFTLTPSAEKFMRRMVRFSSHPAGGFRLSLSPGGCSGHDARFTIEPAPITGDAEMTVNGLRLFLPAESRLLLDGMTVGFTDTATTSGLTFTHPDAVPHACASAAAEAARPAIASVSLSSIRRR